MGVRVNWVLEKIGKMCSMKEGIVLCRIHDDTTGQCQIMPPGKPIPDGLGPFMFEVITDRLAGGPAAT